MRDAGPFLLVDKSARRYSPDRHPLRHAPSTCGRWILTACVGVALLGALSTSVATAQVGPARVKHGMTADDLLRVEKVEVATVDPTNSLMAIVVQRAPLAGEPLMGEGHYRGNIRGDVIVLSSTTGQVVMRTRGSADHMGYWDPTWSPGGDYLAMLTLRGDTLSTCVWHRVTRTTKCLAGGRSLDYLTQLSVGIAPQGKFNFGNPFLWMSDSVLAVALQPRGYVDRFRAAGHRVADSVNVTWARSAHGAEPSFDIVDTPRSEVLADSVEIQLWNVMRGAVRTVFHLPYFADGSRAVIFSLDGQRAAVVADEYHALSDPAMTSGFRNRTHKLLGVVDSLATATVQWYPRRPYTRFLRWASDGSRFGIMAKRSDDEDVVNGSTLLEVDVRTQTVKSAVGAPTDSAIRWKAEIASRIKLPGILPSGQDSNAFGNATGVRRVKLEPGDHLLATSPDLTFAIVRRLTAAGTVVYQVPSDGGAPRMLLSLNSHLANVERGPRRSIAYTSRDGSEQRGVLLLPPGFAHGVPYPLVVFVYPGNVYTDTLDRGGWLRPEDDPFMVFMSPDVLAGHGYVVLLPSMPLVPDSTADDPYAHMLDGVDPAIDTLISHGIVDSTRIGIIGHSYGGYAVNCIVSQSRRFRAAVSSAGLADLTSFTLLPATRYTDWPEGEMAWAETGQGRMHNPPWRDAARYVRNSPISYVDRVGTPILITAADNDFMEQSEEWFSALSRAGKRARFVRYWGEGHVLLSPANIEHFWREVLRWFDTYLQPSQSTAPAGT